MNEQTFHAEFQAVLGAGLSAMGLPAPETALGQMTEYAVFLEERNRVMNLTAITAPAEMARLHFLDSVALLKARPLAGKRVLDVGTGAGFPGLPMKLLEPALDLTLLDSQRKRVDFLKDVVARLKLTGVACMQARAEEQSRVSGFRAGFDCVVSRAVADLRMLAELCLPFVKEGGIFLAMKSSHCEAEVEGAKAAVKRLGGAFQLPLCYALPGTDVVRQVLVIQKVAETPKQYPRRFAKIQKEPL